jgi:hypothetical protein
MGIMAELTGWWAALFVLEIVFIGPVDRYELLLALGAGLVGAVGGVVARRASRRRYELSLTDLRPLLRVPVAVVPETVRLVRLLARRRRPIGAWRGRRVPELGPNRPHVQVAAAAWTLAQCATPGAFVAGLVDGRADVHELRRQGEP